MSNGKPAKGAGDELVEVRFYVPGTMTKEAGSDAENDEEKPDEEEQSAAQAFHEAVKEKAELGEVMGDVIINFEDVLVLTPRGRYDLDMFSEFLRLRGKTYDYKINYSGISRLFLLPKDDQHVLFIVSRNSRNSAIRSDSSLNIARTHQSYTARSNTISILSHAVR